MSFLAGFPWLVNRLTEGDERFAVTGASGWFGRTTLDLLWTALGPRAPLRVTAFASAAKVISLRDGTAVPARPLGELVAFRPAATHVLHFAAPTRDRVVGLGTDAFVRGAAEISLLVARLIEQGHVSAFFLTSSGAVYEAGGAYASDLSTNPYGAMKHLDELSLRQACRDAGVAAVIARVFSVSGSYMTRRHLYALGDLIDQVRAGGPVKVRAAGPVRRSYVGVAEVVALALAEALEPSSPEVLFDASGAEVMEVGELARRVADVLGHPDRAVLRNVDPSAPSDDYFGDPAAMLALARERGLRLACLDEQILETVDGWD